MPSVTELLDRLNVTVTSPDKIITLTCDKSRQVQCRFRSDDDFRGYSAKRLAYQLTWAFCAAEKGRRQGIRQACEAAGLRITDSTSHWDAERRRYHAALAQADARGLSERGFVHFDSTGELDGYQVNVHSDALQQLDAAAFRAEVDSAYTAVLRDGEQKRLQLRQEHLRD